MQRRHFLSGLILLAAPWASAAAQPLRGWFWLRWEAWKGEEATLEFSAIQGGPGALSLPASLHSLPTLNARPRASGTLSAPFRWGKGPCLVCEGNTWTQSPRVIWLEARPSGWAYRVNDGGPWSAGASATLPGVEFDPQDFLPQNLTSLRAVLKANQEEAGAFTSDSAGEMLDPHFRGKAAVVVAPPAWTRGQFSADPGKKSCLISFLEIRFR
jgi:hypothetical protein